MSNSIAVINAGSSSIKFAIYQATKDERCLFRGQVEGIGVAPRLKIADDKGGVVEDRSLDRARLRPRRRYARDHRDRARVAQRRVGYRLRSSRGPRRSQLRRACAGDRDRARRPRQTRAARAPASAAQPRPHPRDHDGLRRRYRRSPASIRRSIAPNPILRRRSLCRAASLRRAFAAMGFTASPTSSSRRA